MDDCYPAEELPKEESKKPVEEYNREDKDTKV